MRLMSLSLFLPDCAFGYVDFIDTRVDVGREMYDEETGKYATRLMCLQIFWKLLRWVKFQLFVYFSLCCYSFVLVVLRVRQHFRAKSCAAWASARKTRHVLDYGVDWRRCLLCCWNSTWRTPWRRWFTSTSCSALLNRLFNWAACLHRNWRRSHVFYKFYIKT